MGGPCIKEPQSYVSLRIKTGLSPTVEKRASSLLHAPYSHRFDGIAFLCRMGSDVLKNWQKKSGDRQKLYKQYLHRADKNDVLKQLPELHEEAFAKVDCLQCANCCKNYSPRFKTTDVKRISKHLGLKESVFIEKYLKVDEEGDFVVQSRPCPFLGADNLCSIYEERPSDCRRFPYTDEDIIFKRQALTLKNSSFCPITYYVLEKLLESSR